MSQFGVMPDPLTRGEVAAGAQLAAGKGSWACSTVVLTLLVGHRVT